MLTSGQSAFCKRTNNALHLSLKALPQHAKAFEEPRPGWLGAQVHSFPLQIQQPIIGLLEVSDLLLQVSQHPQQLEHDATDRPHATDRSVLIFSNFSSRHSMLAAGPEQALVSSPLSRRLPATSTKVAIKPSSHEETQTLCLGAHRVISLLHYREGHGTLPTALATRGRVCCSAHPRTKPKGKQAQSRHGIGQRDIRPRVRKQSSSILKTPAQANTPELSSSPTSVVASCTLLSTSLCLKPSKLKMRNSSLP